MATVSKWTPFGVALDLTATGSSVTRKSATQFTVTIAVSWETYYSGAQTNYGMTATSGGVTKTISAFDGTKRSNGSASFTGTYSISGNGATTKTITVTFKNFNTDNGDSASKTVSFSVSVPAWTSYTIKYNANGGSGAPGNQTKWKDQTLTLSSTKPTRTGYSFLGWSTSSSATTATYSAGGSYTANSAATLYAVWKANTYKVTYNANGGSGAPSAQTKTYGVALTLSSTKPSRTNYTFKGWATSASATTAAYSAGGSYTSNAAVTLYAVWELAYVKPRISNFSVVRCDSGGTASDEGMNALVSFDWECDYEIGRISVKWKLPSDTTWAGVEVASSIPLIEMDRSGTSVGMTMYYDYNGSEASSSGTAYLVSENTYTRSQIIGTTAVCAYDTYGSISGQVVITDDHIVEETSDGLWIKLSEGFSNNAYIFVAYTTNYQPRGLNTPFPARGVYFTLEQEADNIYVKSLEGTPITGSSGSVSRVIGSNGLNTEASYDIHVTVSDGGGSSYVTGTLASMRFVIDALAGGRGVAFGKTAELDDTAEFNFDGKFNKPVYGKALGMDRLPAIPAGSDVNDWLETGCWAIHRNTDAETIANLPVAKAGRFEVWSSTGEGVRSEQWSYLRQRFVPYNGSNAVWEREITRSEDNVWTYHSWWRTSLTPTASEYVYHGSSVLWGDDLTSGMYMTAGHTASLKEAVSAQRHGIILVFSAYNGTSDTNYSWQSFFVPKQLVALSTSGHTFTLGRGKFTYTGTKYLYISDTEITGHADNNLAGTNNGITYDNSKFVLRYVIGV